MTSHQVFYEDDVSDDQESDINTSPHAISGHVRISNLNSALIMPDSDMPMSEGNEEVPQVDMINSLISATLPSGKLTRPTKDLAADRPPRPMHSALRPDLYDFNHNASPQRVPSLPITRRENPQDTPQGPPVKRSKTTHRVGLITRGNYQHPTPKPPLLPAKKQNSRQPPSREVATSAPPVSTSSLRLTRSARGVVHHQLDLSQPRKQRRNCPAVQLDSASEELLPESQSQNEEAIHSSPGPEVLIEGASTVQPPGQRPGSGIHPASLQAVVQERETSLEPPTPSIPPPSEHRQASPVHSLGREVSPLPQAVSVPPGVVQETQKDQSPDSALFVTPESAPRGAQSTAGSQEMERRVDEICKQYASDDQDEDEDEEEDRNNEANDSEDIHIPEQLDEALEFAHDLDEAANSDHVPEELGGINILKSYSRLKRIVGRWRSANDNTKTDDLITLLNDVLKEATSILEKSDWNGERALKHIYTRVLPSLVRMLYVSMVYYLSEAGTIKRLSSEPLKGCRNVTKAVIEISEKVQSSNTRKKVPRPRAAIAMLARIKNVHEILERHLRMLKQVKHAAEYAEKQRVKRERQQVAALEAEAENARRRQIQRERQQAAELEREVEYTQRQQSRRERQRAAELQEQNELKIRNWREHWRVLHDQRFGAELEGQFCLPLDKQQHLKFIPLESASVEYPYWHPHDHIYYLGEGLQEFAGPDVYRKIFRRYCCRGGPLQDFNVSEIVDKAVSLRASLIKVAVEDGEDQEQWGLDIPDPRKPPAALR
ncbi:hypothetical protein D6C79_02814 [Aureobasidium pullulans]|nr:hypothetical protein D6C79_02814 [Aureobasidium pullulans]